MAVRTLLLGRAGTGKTRTVMDRVAPFLGRGREGRAVLLLPNLSQASHVKRLLLGRTTDLAGFFDESVLTFTGLAERVRPDRRIGEILSGRRRDRLLARALGRTSGGPFRALGRYPGFRRAALGLISELKQNGLPASRILSRLADLARRRGGAARARLTAFTELFAAYEEIREEEGRFDHEDFLAGARDALAAKGPGIDPAFFAADGFQNFTRLEREILLALADRSSETLVTLPWDPALERTGGGPLRVARETCGFLLERGFRREILSGNHRARNRELCDFEASLCSEEREAWSPGGAIRVLEGADPEDEADRVARRVLLLLRGEDGPPRRAREILVITRDASSHAARFRRAFRRHGVPLRVYAARDLAHHPFLRDARNLLRILAGDFSAGRMLDLLRSDHVPEVPAAVADLLEHEVLPAGAPGGPAGWEEVLRPLSPEAADLVAALAAFELRPTAAAVLGAVSRFLAPLWKRDLSDPERVREEAGAVAAFRKAVEELAVADGPEGADLSLLLDRLEEALADVSALPGDRRLEAVNLIGAREARQWEAPVVFVSSLLAGEFPRNPREDIFLDDEGRQTANREGGLALKERLVMRDEERYLLYVALTRGRDRLFLTYPVTDGSGRETSRSLFIEELLSRLEGEGTPGEGATPPGGVVSRRRLSDLLPREDEVSGRRDLWNRALLGLSRAYHPGTEEEIRMRRAAALHDLLVGGDEPDRAYVQAARVGFRFLRPPPATLGAPDRIGALAPPPRRHSPTALEEFVQCPFLHFARRTLRLKGAPSGGSRVLLFGELAHQALRLAFAEVVAGRPLPEPDAAGEILDGVIARTPLPVPFGLGEARARQELVQALRRLLEREAARLLRSGLRPTRLETEFRIEEDGIRLSGRIDRIDTSPDGRALVIDYKYSKRGFDRDRRAEIEEGAHLQLPVYLLALERSFGLVPVGAWLVPLLGPRPGGYSLPGAEKPEEAELLTEDELTALLGRTRERVRELDRRIEGGEIAVSPRDPKRCARCDFADLCRVEIWRLMEEA